jgi:hemerythrin-like domain-containing protein
MNIIDALLGEHAVLLTVFDHFQKFHPGWELAQYLEACSLLEALLAQHAVLEDELVFDPLLTKGGRFGETLGLMRVEHDELRRLVADLKHAETAPDAGRILRRLIEITREHFALEERMLFQMATRILGEQRLQELGAEWALRRRLSIAG